MSTEVDWAYDVLGVKPGVSDRELKAAHRDLTKVWHPDRFGHDPRLQDKAQEKLKEINEAYEQLISRHKRRPAPPPRRAQPPPVVSVARETRDVREVVSGGLGWYWWIAALAMFAVVFAVTTKTLLRERAQLVELSQIEEPVDEASAIPVQQTGNPPRSRGESNLAPAAEPEGEPAPVNEAVVAVPTVTVAIDPASGLLATPACPVKSRMTYPSGSEPRGYCNIQHVVKPEKETGLKGLAKRIL
ncbi:MAG TPA: J domain-containing protein [Pyrinomonadaceae bacterium]|nr:J domain-containing protein [Pyrinomonadaceae bacterium]